MEFVLDYYDVALRRKDVDTLKESCWLNDAVIEFYYEYLERKLEAVPGGSRFCFLRPGMVQLLAWISDRSELLAALPPRFQDAAVIFMPVNDASAAATGGGSHWSLLTYCRRDNTFRYYDSLAGLGLSSAKHLARNTARALNLSEDWVFSEVDTPQQDNGADCGVWVLILTRELVKRLAAAGCCAERFPEVPSAANLPSASEERANIAKLVDALAAEGVGSGGVVRGAGPKTSESLGTAAAAVANGPAPPPPGSVRAQLDRG